MLASKHPEPELSLSAPAPSADQAGTVCHRAHQQHQAYNLGGVTLHLLTPKVSMTSVSRLYFAAFVW